ncbi:hypothetical protein Y032_0100g3256 [Ancylostoma ceylanicum]|nr:hypothetical protein Y032_0100g3256 [Ancylostoma ceylanicum]
MHQNDRVERIGDISADGRVDKAMDSQSINLNGVERGDLDRIPLEAKEVQMDGDDVKLRNFFAFSYCLHSIMMGVA